MIIVCTRCNAERETPFCPVCGERLTVNKFIGHNLQQLEHEYEHASHECRWALDRIRQLERKHKEEMKPADEHHKKCVALLREISEARDWARQNNIQHPDYRR